MKALKKSIYSFIGLIWLVSIFQLAFINKPADHTDLDNPVVAVTSTDESCDLTLRDSLVSFAMEQIGKPYKYATRGPSSFDCSGFTHYVFKNFNIALSPASKWQAQEGYQIPIDSAQKGDILVFTGTNLNARTPGHVGMVISEKGESPLTFIHASSGKSNPTVKITELEGYYEKRFLMVRRVIEA